MSAPMNAIAFPKVATLRVTDVSHHEQVLALASAIENHLRAMCKNGERPPNDAPITAWRLTEVLLDMLSNTSFR